MARRRSTPLRDRCCSWARSRSTAAPAVFVWVDARSRTVDMAICRLRRSLAEQGVREVAIESVRRRGYRLALRRRQ